jgi:E-phenylitaconyl-CoA hydratase
MGNENPVLYERRGHVAYLTLNRPERLNAMSQGQAAALRQAWRTFRDDGDAWVAVITGAGNRAFCAGADVKELSARGASDESPPPFVALDMEPSLESGFDVFKPTIAAINGYCLAGGLEMALACDIRIAAEHAQFGLPEVTWSLIPGAGGTQRLPRTVPVGVAMDMILTAERIDAQAALRWGLVSRLVPAEELMPTALKLAETICTRGPLAVRAAKESILRGTNMSIEQGLGLEELFSRQVGRSEDAREGPRAFAEKRPPNFKGQ